MRNADSANLLNGFELYNDATESSAPLLTSIDTLAEKLVPFNDDNCHSDDGFKMILAINLGTLNNFIDSEKGAAFSKLKKYVEANEIFSTFVRPNEYQENSVFQHVSFSDYQIFTLKEELIRKDNFFSRIYIDGNFVVRILRDEEINKADLLSLLRTGSFSAAISALGETAIAVLTERYQAGTATELRKKISDEVQEQIVLPVEIGKDRLSSGEKQIFVMSLYWAMMNQSKNELPFIIDTPFARIDAEHRANITEYFFKRLPGQLLILSTDEEISSKHLDAMKEQISHVYMLEYGSDKRTHICENQYFEV